MYNFSPRRLFINIYFSMNFFCFRWITYGNSRVPFDPAFFCDSCFQAFNYSPDGKKNWRIQSSAVYGSGGILKNWRISNNFISFKADPPVFEFILEHYLLYWRILSGTGSGSRRNLKKILKNLKNWRISKNLI